MVASTASAAPVEQKATPMRPDLDRLHQTLHDYPLTTVYLAIVAWVALILAVAGSL